MKIRPAATTHPAEEPSAAATHFEDRLRFEADCADVAHDLENGVAEFVVVDCRSPSAFASGHIPGAVNLPYRRITAETVGLLLPPDRLVITYCSGPHCNASTRGALAFARLGRRVKEMPGGLLGWRAEGFALETGPGADARRLTNRPSAMRAGQ